MSTVPFGHEEMLRGVAALVVVAAGAARVEDEEVVFESLAEVERERIGRVHRTLVDARRRHCLHIMAGRTGIV